MSVSLVKNDLLQGFAPDWVQWFEDHCIAVGFEPGDYMIEGGHTAAGLYVLLDGEAAVLSDSGETIAVLKAGGIVGEMALVDGGRRSADVIAETDVAALLMTKHQFEAISRERPDIALQVMTNLCQIMSMRLRHVHQLLR